MINFKSRNRKISAKPQNFSIEDLCAFAGFCAFAVLLLSSCAAHRTHFMTQVNFKTLKDGTYIGQDTVAVPPCSVKLATTIKNGSITEIKILSHIVSYPLAGRAYSQIPQRIIKEQSLDVDAVTAATVSTNNIKRAVLEALKKAQE